MLSINFFHDFHLTISNHVREKSTDVWVVYKKLVEIFLFMISGRKELTEEILNYIFFSASLVLIKVIPLEIRKFGISVEKFWIFKKAYVHFSYISIFIFLLMIVFFQVCYGAMDNLVLVEQ